MGLVERNREPTPFELRIFGLIVAAIFGLVGWTLLRRFQLTTAAGVVWALGLALVALYYAVPGVRRTIYHVWMTAFYPLGWLVSHTLLAIVYFLVLTPIGLLARLFGHDALDRRFDRAAKSYWIAQSPDPDTSHYFKQF